MICVSLTEKSVPDCLKALENIPFAEIRLDRMALNPIDIERIFSVHPQLIATCRPGSLEKEIRHKFLTLAVQAGAAYVDIELEADETFKNSIFEAARKRGCRTIISYHNFEKTPGKPELENIVTRGFDSGADLVKIACKVNGEKDNVRLLSLLEEDRPLVVVGLGPKGRLTRYVAPLLGSPFTYASLSPGKETAEGQMDWKSLERLLDFMKNA